MQASLCLLGEVCPKPLFETQKTMKGLDAGEMLLVETDFSRAVRNILDWCEREGHTFDLDEGDPGTWQIRIYKSQPRSQ